MIQEKLQELMHNALTSEGISADAVLLEHPVELSHGDFATNAALVFGKQNGKNPKELAEALLRHIEAHKTEEVEKAEVAGPGFINFYLSQEFFASATKQIIEQKEKWGSNQNLKGKKVMVEYTDPNPFKEFHIGHLMSNAIGESISRLIEFFGAEVRRANYQGDVGLHVAKALWGKQQKPEANWGEAYALGARSYDEYKEEIDVLNRKIYEKDDEDLNNLYKEGKDTSYEAFENMYRTLDTTFDDNFLESEVSDSGIGLVQSHPDAFEESDGATVFRGEDYDPSLHTRVFITSQGLPTYEAKELGLAKKKFETWPHDLSIVVTANEIAGYYKVVMKALQQVEPDLAAKIKHVTHGLLKLPPGKMSSRTGDVVSAELLIAEVIASVLKKMKENDKGADEKTAELVAIAALKYAILKQGAGKDVVFDKEQALSFEGDSGPYLQYTHTRARSVLEKAESNDMTTDAPPEWEIIDVERLLYRFPEVVERAGQEYEPHYVTTYLIELAGTFNSWYGKEKILDSSPKQGYKLALTEATATTLKNGLWLLGIKAPERM